MCQLFQIIHQKAVAKLEDNEGKDRTLVSFTEGLNNVELYKLDDPKEEPLSPEARKHKQP